MLDGGYIGVMVAALLMPPLLSLWLRYRALRASNEAATWFKYARLLRIVRVLAVPAWWSLWAAFTAAGANSRIVLGWPPWVMLLFAPAISILVERLVAYRSDTNILGRGWTKRDILHLALWSTLSSTVPLLMVAIGIEAIYDRSAIGILWLSCAGVATQLATVRLRSAEGIKPRAVKSGELYKRSHMLAKKMEVGLRQVCVVPSGRGRLTNAYGGSRDIAVTDDYGHWLHGPQLDFVIAHELAHAKQKHARKKVLVAAGVFALPATLTLAIPHLVTAWRVVFNFGAILVPLAVFYFVSRRFEYAADRAAVELTHEAEAAIRALMNRYRQAELPTQFGRFEELFSTHPGLQRRVDEIARVGQVSAERVSGIRDDFNQSAVGRQA